MVKVELNAKPMNTKQADLWLYILKCLLGTAIGFYLYRAWPNVGGWCMISIIIVLAPDRKDAINLSVNRIKANLVGAAIGLLLFAIHPMNLLMMSIGITLAILACEMLNLQAVTRTAGVAVMIILIHEKGKYFWDVALERAAGVIGGCLIAMVLTYLFHYVIVKSKRLQSNH